MGRCLPPLRDRPDARRQLVAVGGVSMSEPIGDMEVAREEGSVVLTFDMDGEEESAYITPEQAAQVAMWLNTAAAEAKQWQQHEGSP